ncbi:MAG: LacI family DNA-binding transcriptional regulator [Lachnospiraceae bacterium]|nr:LacI family DNA-binding transcriptional regulator [Lachnospiraceae bacterium]
MVTIKEIARECGVSVATVSNILNGRPNVGEETRMKVLEVVRSKGYQPDYNARGLRKRRTNMIGIIAEDICQFSTPAIMEGIMRHCEKQKYRTVIQNLRLYARWGEFWYENESAYRSVLDPVMQEMMSIRVEGLLYVAGHARVVRYFSDAMPIPTVLAYAYTHSPYTPAVIPDDEKAACEMTRYLISMGHRKIGILAGKADNIHTGSRLRGHQRALFEENILYNPGWVRYGDWERRSGYRFAGELVDEGVTAIFCMNDRMAGGVYDYFREHGIRVGDDISVAGFDNQEISQYCSPALTTMELPLYEIGTEAAAILLESLDTDEKSGPDGVMERSIPCKLIERESVKRAASGTEEEK